MNQYAANCRFKGKSLKNSDIRVTFHAFQMLTSDEQVELVCGRGHCDKSWKSSTKDNLILELATQQCADLLTSLKQKSQGNLHWIEPDEFRSSKVMVWYSIWRSFVIESFFFHSTVTEPTYLDTKMISMAEEQCISGSWP